MRCRRRAPPSTCYGTLQGRAFPRRSRRSPASEIQPALHSIAADEGIDLVVMGGYHYSWLKEKLLGHSTRTMLQAMTIPVLTSH
ncbi:universal stress protein [Bradyrhizobium macuxiense]|uniref:universal stress protein n=1 Tax=Bradyrhizobium macuxiense TaxID=1755647 RepID=UPI0032E4D8C0